MRPLFGNVIIKPITEEKTEGGLYRPESAQNDPIKKGEVISVGSGSLAYDGSPIEMEVHGGETVLYKANLAYPIKIGKENHFIIEQRDIVAVV